MVAADKRAQAVQPELPEQSKGPKPSLAIGSVEAAYKVVRKRMPAFVALMVNLIRATIDHATPQRRQAVALRVSEMRDSIGTHYQVLSSAVDVLNDHVKADANAALASERPKFVRRTAEALRGLGLDIDTASEFVSRKQTGTPFEDDGGVHDEILLALGFTLASHDEA